MDNNESFVHSETWQMEKFRQRRFQQKMSSLLSPVTPKRNYGINNAKSLLLQCLRERDSNSDPLPRRRFPISCSDEGIMMDGVLVTSASGKKVSDSPTSSLGRSASSLIFRSQHKNTEFSSPRSESGRKKENNQSQNSSGGKGKILANSPSTQLETSKAANPSNLQATAEPFILTPRSSQRLASPFPLQQLPYDHDPHFHWGNPLPHQQLPPGYGQPRPLHGPRLPYLQLPASPWSDLYQTHYLPKSPRPTGYQNSHGLNQSTTNNDPRISLLPTTPPTSQPKTYTSKPPLHSPTCSRLDYLPSLDELHTVTQKLDLSSLSDELETMTQTQDLLPPSYGLETMPIEKDWSPSDDGLPTFTQDQTDFMNTHRRILPDDAFELYKHRQRLPVFTQFYLDDNSAT